MRKHNRQSKRDKAVVRLEVSMHDLDVDADSPPSQVARAGAAFSTTERAVLARRD